MLERSSCDQLGALLETVDIVDCEMATKEREGYVAKVVCCLGTGVEGFLVSREVLQDHP